MKVSGVPPLEKSLARTRPEYHEYARCTSDLLPWPPRPSSCIIRIECRSALPVGDTDAVGAAEFKKDRRPKGT
ncbi:MAG: hypothetical protein A2Y95_00835 [Deltaproteobacteria bacterium RBG_13_65_10]|nr:MAG: hypothetical protein A2Y95_00835 [Deltaproteobacteria bacterium RBG_13_65_10]